MSGTVRQGNEPHEQHDDKHGKGKWVRNFIVAWVISTLF
jgi:hypothetical protein